MGQEYLKDSSLSIKYFPESSIFLELGGNGINASISFEQVILSKNHKLSLRVGVGNASYGIVFGPPNKVLTIPTELIYLLGKDMNYLDIGLGISFARESYMDKISRYFFIVPRVSYRRYNKKENRYFRIGYTPILDQSVFGCEKGHQNFPIFFGAGIGFVFKY